MAMNSLQSLTLSLLITLCSLSLTSHCLLLLISPTTSSTTPIRGLMYEEKTRLGSTPPSCHNKCNLCHPCMAVQVPTMPGHNRVKPGQDRVKPVDYYDQPPSGGSNNRYSNYKPLGWKCRCGGHLYNP
ncbi:putative EPIDERMAL PATTERNING FACTOR-like protein [Helianthus anomalus]